MDFSHLSSAEYTDVGKKRRVNEDSVIRIPEQGIFFVEEKKKKKGSVRT